MTETSPRCIIHGYDFTSIVYAEGVDPSGGAIGIDEIQVPGRQCADIGIKGRGLRKYKIRARSTDRDEIETFLQEVNNAPVDAEFYPMDAERCGLIASAYATIRSLKMWGAGKIFYEADAEIVCREAWLNGPAKGIDFTRYPAIPSISPTLTNEGHERSPISYFQASGDLASGNYVEGLTVRITPGTSTEEHDRELVLCDKLLRDDIFEMGWRGEIKHTWTMNTGKTWDEISRDLHRKTFGGAKSGNILTLSNGDYIMIPFHGPLPITGDSDAAYLEFEATSVGGDVVCCVAQEPSLSDFTFVDHEDLVVGINKIYIPDLAGAEHAAIGIMAKAGGSISLSSLTGSVKRYIAPSKIPAADPDESFKIRVESTLGPVLKFLQATYYDRYWY